MSEESDPNPVSKTPSGTVKWMPYLLGAIVFVVSWTVVEFTTHRWPLAQRLTFPQSLRYASWTTPIEGGGPLVMVSAMSAYVGRPDNFDWFAPLFGAGVYLTLSVFASKFGRHWTFAEHLLLSLAWLATGAIIITAIFQK